MTILKGTTAETLGLDFCIYKTNEDESLEMIELCENGPTMMVNEANKQKYIAACVEYYTEKSCS